MFLFEKVVIDSSRYGRQLLLQVSLLLVFLIICYVFAFITDDCITYDRSTFISFRKGKGTR